MSDKLKDSQDAHDPDQAHDLASLPYNLDVLQVREAQGQVKGDDGQQVDHVHGVAEELPLPGGAREPQHVLDREEDDGHRVDVVQDDVGHGVGVLLRLFLEVLHGGQDERQGRDQDHAKG